MIPTRRNNRKQAILQETHTQKSAIRRLTAKKLLICSQKGGLGSLFRTVTSLRGLPSFTVCRVLSLLQPIFVLGTRGKFIRDVLVHYSPTVDALTVLLSAIRISFWSSRINALPSTLNLVRTLFPGAFAKLNLSKFKSIWALCSNCF